MSEENEQTDDYEFIPVTPGKGVDWSKRLERVHRRLDELADKHEREGLNRREEGEYELLLRKVELIGEEVSRGTD